MDKLKEYRKSRAEWCELCQSTKGFNKGVDCTTCLKDWEEEFGEFKSNSLSKTP